MLNIPVQYKGIFISDTVPITSDNEDDLNSLSNRESSIPKVKTEDKPKTASVGKYEVSEQYSTKLVAVVVPPLGLFSDLMNLFFFLFFLVFVTVNVRLVTIIIKGIGGGREFRSK